MITEKFWVFVAETSMIPMREGKRVRCGNIEIALFNAGNNEFFAIDNACPHKKGPLSDGIMSGKTVFCPLHNWNISLEDGCAKSGGEGSVKAYPVKIEDSKIFICLTGENAA